MYTNYKRDFESHGISLPMTTTIPELMEQVETDAHYKEYILTKTSKLISKLFLMEDGLVYLLMMDLESKAKIQFPLELESKFSHQHCQGKYSNRLFIYDNDGAIRVYIGSIDKTDRKDMGEEEESRRFIT